MTDPSELTPHTLRALAFIRDANDEGRVIQNDDLEAEGLQPNEGRGQYHGDTGLWHYKNSNIGILITQDGRMALETNGHPSGPPVRKPINKPTPPINRYLEDALF